MKTPLGSRSSVFAALLPATAVFFAAAAAWTCSLEPPSLHGPTAPESDRIELPANTQLLIDARRGRSARVEIIEAQSEAAYTASLDRWSGLHLVSLSDFAMPGNTYTLRFWGTGNGFDSVEPGDPEIEVREAVTLTLGQEDDVTAPSHDGAMGVPETVYSPGSDLLSSCGIVDGDRYTVTIVAPPSSDDFGVAGHRLLVVGDNGGETVVGVTLQKDDTLHHSVSEPIVVRYVIETFDYAGNAVRTEDIDVDYSFAPRSDAHPAALGGCSATGVPKSSPWWAVSLLMVMAFSRPAGRRRARRGARS